MNLLYRPILSLTLIFIVGSASAQLPKFHEQAFELPESSKKLLIADFNGDEKNDLLVDTSSTLRIYFQQENGFNFDHGFAEIDFSGQSVGWDLSTNYRDDDGLSLIALVDGNEVSSWHAEGNEIIGPTTIVSNLDGYISKGLNRLHFSRDIDDDGFEDLVIPGAGQLQIYVNAGDARYQSPLTITTDFRIRTNLVSDNLERRIGQAIRIPLMELRDVNSDGLADLISRTEERLDVFLANPNAGSYFSVRPSYSLNIAEIEERLGDFDIDNLDFSNLTGVLALTHEELLEDVDGDGIDDLLLREGSKVSMFAGTATGMDFDQPRQVLRSGGNVLSTFLHDENEDGLKDLWLWRVEPISVSDIFVWLALSGSIAIEAFIYPNEGQRFSRRPARKITVDLKFPSVMRLANTFRGLEDEVEQGDDDTVLISARGDLNASGSPGDLLAVVNNQLSLFVNSLEPDNEDTQFLGALGYSRDRNSYEINIRDALDQALNKVNQHQSAVARLDADLTIPLPSNITVSDILTAPVNNDLTDDIFVFNAQPGSQITGLLLLSGE